MPTVATKPARDKEWSIIEGKGMKTTAYFENNVLRKRPYIRREWCARALREPLRTEEQPDGRFRYWTYVPELDSHLRVVTLEDRETVHNAMTDRI